MTLLYFFKIFCENLNIFNTDIIQIGICHLRERTTVPPPLGISKKISIRNFKNKCPYSPQIFKVAPLRKCPGSCIFSCSTEKNIYSNDPASGLATVM